MPYDAFLVSKIVSEIKTPVYLTGIHAGPKGTIVLSLKKQDIVLDMNVWPHIHVTNNFTVSDDNPSAFISLMRARLKGAVLVKVEQVNFDRIVRFTFDVENLIGEKETFELYHEVTGIFGNLVLVKDEICLGAFKDVISSKRTILRGSKYIPPEENRVDPLSVGEEIFTDLHERLDRALVKKVRGLSKKDALEITRRAEISFDTIVRTLTTEEQKRILNTVHEIAKEAKEPGAYMLIENGIPKDVYAFKPFGKSKHFDSVSKSIELLLSGKKRHTVIESKRSNLKKLIKRLINKTEYTISKVAREIHNAEGANEFKKYGQLLIANLHSFPKRADHVEVTDWESGEKISIKLDQKIDVSKNAQHFFKVYSNLKRQLEGAKKRQKILKKRLLYLQELQDEVEDAANLNELTDIEIELAEGGFTPKKNKIKRKRQKDQESIPLTVEYKGFKIIVGKNNIQNDRITLKMASNEDIWFHAREVPGSHVVIVTAGKKPPQEVIKMAASLAAGHSRYKEAEWVDVDYTLIKNVSKPKGARPGFVLYRNFKTLRVKPERWNSKGN